MKILVLLLVCILIAVVVAAQDQGIDPTNEDSSVQIKRQRREPNVQAYGLPKRLLMSTNSGVIERIHLGTRLSIAEEQFNKSSDTFDAVNPVPPVRANPLLHIRVHQPPRRDFGDVEGHLEIVSVNSDDLQRRRRSVDDDSQFEDLQAEEAKIFRPLFVYRQQMAERHRANRSKNPIYDAYQYGLMKRPSHHVQKGDSYLKKGQSSSVNRRVNWLV